MFNTNKDRHGKMDVSSTVSVMMPAKDTITVLRSKCFLPTSDSRNDVNISSLLTSNPIPCYNVLFHVTIYPKVPKYWDTQK